MRAVMMIAASGALLMQAGCDAQPVSRSVNVPQASALPLYRAISANFARCNDAAEKAKDVGFRVTTNTISRGEGYQAADQQAGTCNQVADNILKLGTVRLPSELESASAEATVQTCVSDALAKAQAGGTLRKRIDVSGEAHNVGIDKSAKATDDLSESCTTALSDFAKASGITQP